MKVKMIGRGLNGWHADTVGEITLLSGPGGGTTQSRGSSSGGSLEEYLGNAEDGVPVYDAEGAHAPDFVALVLSGPMVDATLPPGSIKRFQHHTTLRRMMQPGGLGGDFHTLGALELLFHDEGDTDKDIPEQTLVVKIGSLDSVAPDVYLALLRKIPGVMIGKVVNHRIVWEGIQTAGEAVVVEQKEKVG